MFIIVLRFTFCFHVKRVLFQHFGRLIVGNMSEHSSLGLIEMELISYGFGPQALHYAGSKHNFIEFLCSHFLRPNLKSELSWDGVQGFKVDQLCESCVKAQAQFFEEKIMLKIGRMWQNW